MRLSKKIASKVESRPWVALDTEADSLHHYKESLCLIQISHDGQHALIDPLADVDLRPLWDLLIPARWIFQGADYDLRMLASVGAPAPVEIFDTMLAAQLAGRPGLGYAALVKDFCGIDLCKSSQRSDWSIRPLSNKMVDYAVQDTAHLETLRQELTKQLMGLGRLEWHRQACARVLRTSRQPAPVDLEERWRLKGSNRLAPQSLAVLKSLWEWREREAERADVPVFRVLHNERMLAFANWAGTHLRVPPQGSSLWPNYSPERARRLVEAVEAGRAATPPSPLPAKPRQPRNAAIDRRLEKLRDARDTAAAKLKLDPTILASKITLYDIARDPDTAPARLVAEDRWCQWQADLLAPALSTMR